MRYAILSDIHANYEALRAVLHALPPRLPIWFLGDAVGYYPDSIAVLDTLSALEAERRLVVWLKGNHDEAAYLPPTTPLDMNSVARTVIRRTTAQLAQAPGPARLALLEALPVGPQVAPGEPELTRVHAAPDAPLSHYLEHVHDAWAAASACTTPVCLVGHTHIPSKLSSPTPGVLGSWTRQELFQTQAQRFHYAPSELTFLNPGSVGQPRDGFAHVRARAYAAYGLLDTGARTLSVQRVEYDPAPLFERTRSWLAGHLPEQEIERLCARLLRGV